MPDAAPLLPRCDTGSISVAVPPTPFRYALFIPRYAAAFLGITMAALYRRYLLFRAAYANLRYRTPGYIP